MSKRSPKPNVMDDPAVAALVHKQHRDIAERLGNQWSRERDAWRVEAQRLAVENAYLRMRCELVKDALKRHDDAIDNPFADHDEAGEEPTP